MEYKVIVSDKASHMLASHIRFIAQVNKNAAKKTKENLLNAFHSLSEFPERFPFFNEPYIIFNKYHKMFVEKWYLVLYQIKDNTVYIDYVLDCRKEYNWLIK